MADAKGQYQKLPPGWDCKYDQATGNCYYINYFTKAMQLEDPRGRYKQLQNERCSTESIPMQPMHGSPYHVYPSNNLTAVRAFQAGPGNNTSLHNMSSSPLLSSRGNLELSPLLLPRSSLTQTPRLGNMSRRSTIQETSFTNPIDTDAVVNKIQNMFPTASEDHIRLLLKKYMKTIFPKADEMVLLDILASSDNNVQTASEKLISMGYTKRDFIPPKTTPRADHEVGAHAATAAKRTGDETIIPLRPKEFTAAEKEAIQAHMKEKYPLIAERIILMALESVNYAEDRAMQILHIVHEEDELHAKKNAATAAAAAGPGGDVALQSLEGASAAEILSAGHDGVDADDSIITVIVKTPLNSYIDDKNASAKSVPSLTSSPPISSSPPNSSSSSSSTSSAPQLPNGALKSSTKIKSNRNIGKKVAFPSIKLTTPTTTTTQIILSNSTKCMERNMNASAEVSMPTAPVVSSNNSTAIIHTSVSPSSYSKMSPSKTLKGLHISSELPSTSFTSVTASSSFNSISGAYEKITTKNILARCNTYTSGVQGYLNGTNSNKHTATTASDASTSTSILEKLKLTRSREKTDPLKDDIQQSVTDGLGKYKQRKDFKSIVGRITTTGHSADLAKGADESLLLADYVTWNGANPDMPHGSNQKLLAHGPDAGKLGERSYAPIGHNTELCKGAQKGLAKGSIYGQLAAADIKCN
ncbi:putative GPI-anchored protein pfl2 isoform X2 [Ceratitis capitata]|uniref:putative GPI-anchored protein pfl2 isoform X2 n=1 Tax=Ceratitis capitata TaxID=7213 RepID=UPI00061893EC|nr:putative GPI-anchored protein pfl2 isoform X2 [Ceratitis capitata]